MSFPPHRRFVKPLCGGFFIQVPFILFHLRLSLCLQASSVPLHIAKLNGRLCGTKRPHSVSEQPNFYQSLQSNPYNDSSHPSGGE